MLRIGLISGEYPPMQGGVGAFTQELARALALCGHDIHIITGRATRLPNQKQRIDDLWQPEQLPFAQLHTPVHQWRWSALSAVADIAVRYELDVLNIQYQAAAYDMRSPAANFLPWRLNGIGKTVVTFHDLRVPYLFPKAGRLRETAVRFMAKQAHGVIVTNGEDFVTVKQQMGVTAVRQIPIGSNIQTTIPTATEITAARSPLQLAPTDRLLGYFGFLNESKGADTLLQTMAQLPPHVHLVFIGGQTGSSDTQNNQTFLAHLQQMIETLGLNGRIHWTGFVADEAASAYLQTSDVMVMPYRDGVSLRRGTLMAVLANGRPLITTHPTIPTPELVHGQNVWLVPPDEPTALAQAIQTLLADAPLCSRLGQGATQVADLFTWDKIAIKTAEFFNELLA